MNIREEARKLGGDELVAKMDRADEMRTKLQDQLAELIGAFCEGSEGEERVLRFAVCCEALSDIFSRTAALNVEATDHDRSGGIMCAVKSVTSNMNCAFEDIDAAKSGVLDLINKVKENEPLPKPEEK